MRPAEVPLMPEIINTADYTTDGLMLGLSVNTLEPVDIDPDKEQFLLISGYSGGNRTGLLRMTISGLPEKLPGVEVIIYDPAPGELKELQSQASPEARYISDPEEFDEYMSSLMPVLQSRKERADEDDMEFIAQQNPILIVVSDIGKYFKAANESTRKRMGNIVNLGRGLKVHLVVSGRNEDIVSLHYGGDMLTMSLVGKAAALLTGGSFHDHSVFKSNMSFNEASAELSPAEGFYIAPATGTVKIKFVQH